MAEEPVELPKIGPELADHTQDQHVQSMKDRVRTLVDPPAPGRYADWEMEDYLCADALNASTIRDICPPKGDPELALRKRFWKKTETDSTKLGTAIHKAILEPDAFDKTYIVTPTKGKGLKQWRLDAKEAGYVSISQLQMDIARTARDNAHAHHRAGRLLAGIKREHVEQTFFFQCPARAGDEIVPVMGKMRADLCRDDIEIWVDIKSTRKVEPYGWSGESAHYDYDLTKAWYEKGIDLAGQSGHVGTITDYFFLVVENQFPVRVELYHMGNATTTCGQDRLSHALGRWAECVAADDWPSERSGDVRPYDHPDYYFTEWGAYLEHLEKEPA